MRKKTLRCIAVTLMAAFVVAVLPADLSYAAALSEVSAPAKVTTFKSTTTFDKEYLRAYVTTGDDRVLKVIYRTPLKTTLFRLSLYRVGENSGDIDLDIYIEPTLKKTSDGTLTYNFTYYLNMEDREIPDGKYNIYIRRCETEEDAANLKYNNNGVLNKNMEIQVTDGKVKILRHMDVIYYNRDIQAIGELYDPSRYLDLTLEDIQFVLKNPATNEYATMTEDKIAYIKSVSDRIVSGISGDYNKLLKIYEYSAGNFYYDSVAFKTHSNQYADPYENIRNFEYGLSSVNSQKGRVYTTCQGYSAIFVALARAQGIPCRFVYGHRLGIPSNDWLTEDNIDVKDHWWVEAYVDGRWIFVDPTVGTTNKYDSSTGKWQDYGLTNYTYFDPSEEQIASSHVYMNIYPDYRHGRYITNEYEIEQLLAFLNSQNSKGITNGELLDSTYDPADKETWGDGYRSHFMLDGKGNTTQIQWSYKDLSGALNIPEFKTLRLLSSHDNALQSVDASGCPKLEKVFLYNNDITSIDLSDCKELWYVRAQNNPMKELKIYVNGKNRTFRADDHGTFYFTIDDRYVDVFSLYSEPDIGYKLEGIYSTVTGNRLSTKTTWHFEPKANGYRIAFKLDPDSYKYTIYPGDSQSYKREYIRAAAKRLEELGYYHPNSGAGKETSYTKEMQEAVIKFQVVNDISNTGNIATVTWSTLFSNNASEMVSDSRYQEILVQYEARKAAEAQAKKELKPVTLRASSTAGKGYIKITWTVSGVSSTDMIDGYEIWKSSKKSSGFKKSFTTTKTSYKNTAGLKKGTRYYYKVRAYQLVGDKKVYSDWSTKAYRVAK